MSAELPAIRTQFGDADAELYLAEPNETARVVEDLSTLPGFEHAPWLARYVQASSTCRS